MNSKNKIVIATGGTGGHVFPSISLGNFLTDYYNIEIFTDERGLKYLEDYKNLKIRKIVSSRVFSKNIIYIFVGVIKVFLSTISSIILLNRSKPKLIVGMGGYASFSVCLAGYFLKIPIIIYENNLVIGRANKFLLPFVKKILVSTNNITGIKKKYNSKVSFTGFLLRNKIFNLKRNITQINQNNLSILIMGGSQSAKVFGEEIPEIIKKCHDYGIKFNIYQQCMEAQKSKISDIYKKLNINFELFSYTDDISTYYKKSDLAITRCGASSLSELVNLNIPFIAIPLPSSMDNHQLKNAKYFQNEGFCFLLEQKYLLEKLFDMLKSLHENKKILRLFKEKMIKHSDKEALYFAKKIIKETING